MDDDVLALVDSIQDFFERRGDAEAIAASTTGPANGGMDRWSQLCAMGLPMLRVVEPDGIGAALLEATAVAEAFGAVLLPEPASASVVLAKAWAAHPAVADRLEGLCAGSQVVSLSALDTVSVTQSGEINGTVRVPGLGMCDAVAVLACDEYTDASALVVLDAATLPAPISRQGVDPTRPVDVVELLGIEPADVVRLDTSEARAIRIELVTLYCAELVGGMQRVLRDTVAFVGTREQFGRPIGSFQSIKHQLADAYAGIEQARALVQLAAVTYAQDPGAAASIAETAARWVPRTAITISEKAIHLHGGMGFSWEVPAHLHLRRALSLRSALADFVNTGTTAGANMAEAV